MKIEGKKLAELAAEFASEKKASNITILDLRELDYVADFFVIASADNFAQVGAIADNIESELRKAGVYPYHTELDNKSNWMLLDYSDVIVHIFEEQTRKFYSLERLWGDAKVLRFGETVKAVETARKEPEKDLEKARAKKKARKAAKKIKITAKILKKRVTKGKKKDAGAGKTRPKTGVKKSSHK